MKAVCLQLYVINADPQCMWDEQSILEQSIGSCEALNAKVHAHLSKAFTDGVSNLVMAGLAHTGIHTWPDINFAEISISSYNYVPEIYNAIETYRKYFKNANIYGVEIIISNTMLKTKYFVYENDIEFLSQEKLKKYLSYYQRQIPEPMSSDVVISYLHNPDANAYDEKYLGELTINSVLVSNANLHGFLIKKHDGNLQCHALLAESHNIAFSSEHEKTTVLSLSTCKPYMNTLAGLECFKNSLRPHKICSIRILHKIYSDNIEISILEQ